MTTLTSDKIRRLNPDLRFRDALLAKQGTGIWSLVIWKGKEYATVEFSDEQSAVLDTMLEELGSAYVEDIMHGVVTIG